jgi:hypothetical protein
MNFMVQPLYFPSNAATAPVESIVMLVYSYSLRREEVGI